MGINIRKTFSPEEEELKKKETELNSLENDLAQRELDFATLQAELNSFEAKYMRIVGGKYSELDRLKAKIAALLAKKNPQNDDMKKQAEDAQQQYEKTAHSVGDQKIDLKSEIFKPNDRLKSLYREIARKVHPDLATDEHDRERRNRIMAEVNKAYKEGDEKRLLEILHEWETSPESVTGEDSGAKLVRTIRKIAQIKIRLKKISREIEDLEASELFILKIKVEEAFKIGKDLLSELAYKISEDIKVEKRKLALLMEDEYR